MCLSELDPGTWLLEMFGAGVLSWMCSRGEVGRRRVLLLPAQTAGAGAGARPVVVMTMALPAANASVIAKERHRGPGAWHHVFRGGM